MVACQLCRTLGLVGGHEERETRAHVQRAVGLFVVLLRLLPQGITGRFFKGRL